MLAHATAESVHCTHRTSTIDCLKSDIRVCCLLGFSTDAVGPYGMNAASEYADDRSVRWNGIVSVSENTRDAGMYSYGGK